MDKNNTDNIVIAELRESLIMRPVKVHIPMPQGAAVPAQPAGTQAPPPETASSTKK